MLVPTLQNGPKEWMDKVDGILANALELLSPSPVPSPHEQGKVEDAADAKPEASNPSPMT